MRKVFWTAATAALLVGAYWSVAHATVHPGSPVGQALAWFGLRPSAAAPAVGTACVRGPACHDEATPSPIQVEAFKPAGLIVLEPGFRPMPDPDGVEFELPVVVRTPAVREVVVPGEEFRIMPEPEPARPELIAEEPVEVPAEPKNTLSVGIRVGAACPIELCCTVKMGDCCHEMTLTGLYALLTGRATGKACPCQECPAAGKEGCKDCPAGGKPCARVPERLAEPPAEVEKR